MWSIAPVLLSLPDETILSFEKPSLTDEVGCKNLHCGDGLSFQPSEEFGFSASGGELYFTGDDRFKTHNLNLKNSLCEWTICGLLPI